MTVHTVVIDNFSSKDFPKLLLYDKFHAKSITEKVVYKKKVNSDGKGMLYPVSTKEVEILQESKILSLINDYTKTLIY